MSNIVKITNFRNNISDYINRVIYNNESFYLKKGKSVVAKIIFCNSSLEKTKNKRSIMDLVGLWKDMDKKKMAEFDSFLKAADKKSKKDVLKFKK